MILILGASGRIGGYLFNRFKEDGFEVVGTYYQAPRPGLVQFNLNTMSLNDLKLVVKPTHIIFGAAANPTPELSKDWNNSYPANVPQTRKLINDCFKEGIIPIYLSTDNVFDGDKGNYKETDETHPLNNYGKMKCEVESHLFVLNKPCVLLRMGKVFGIDETLIVETFKNLKEGRELPYAIDQVFTPIYSEDLYEFVRDTIQNNFQGVFHLGSTEPTTRYEVAQKIKSFFKLKGSDIVSCKINELGLSEKRPLKIDLNLEKYKKLTGKEERELEYFFDKLIKVSETGSSALLLNNLLADHTKWEYNSQGNSLAYFAKAKQVSVNREMLNELKKISEEKGNINARFCLHTSPDENLQDMVILAHKDKTCRRLHQHKTGKEAIHLIEGRALALIFDQRGNLIEKKILDAEGDFVYRNNQGTYHIYFPLTKYIILREIRDGGNKLGETDPPEWDWIEAISPHISSVDLKCYNDFCKNPCLLKSAFSTSVLRGNASGIPEKSLFL